jgi:hypothetical protein
MNGRRSIDRLLIPVGEEQYLSRSDRTTMIAQVSRKLNNTHRNALSVPTDGSVIALQTRAETVLLVELFEVFHPSLL